MSKDFATFILGGAGFVGSRLIKRLDIKNKKYFVGDINDSSEKTIKINNAITTSNMVKRI